MCKNVMRQDLHSNMFLLIHRAPEQTGQPVLAFTFQYVSINTKDTEIRFNYSLKFTFQYVSINTNSQQRTFVPLAHLHSNMFLLIPNARRPCVLA